jgi:NAD(P)-dependent dehydrogenase (short-subunit alcohol dehydrogenase family)
MSSSHTAAAGSRTVSSRVETRVAVVAGAGGGLGKPVALALHEAGLTVVAVDRTPSRLDDLPAGIHRETADVTDPAAAAPLMERVAATAGAPDILVNTVGTYAGGDHSTITPEGLRSLMDVNLGAAVWLTQAVVPYMREKGAGAIVHTGARAGVEAGAGAAAYGVTKAALAHLGRVLDLELRPHGIRVNVILPGIIETAANAAVLPPSVMARAVSPTAIARVVSFLVGEDAAPVTGALVPVYGV